MHPIKLDLPEGTKSLSSRALMGNKKLVKVTIPKTLDRIGEMAFDGCSSLGEVVWNADSASIVEDHYYGFKVQLFSPSLSKITFGEGVRVLPPSFALQVLWTGGNQVAGVVRDNRRKSFLRM